MDDRGSAHAAAFDAIGGRYDEAFPNKDGQQAAVEALLTRLPVAGRVLDVGCGTGLPTARQLTDAGCQVVGIDISSVMVGLARRNVPEATFLQRDILMPGGELGRFDAVVAFFSLLMLTRDGIHAALARIRDVLQPDGRLVLGMVEADVDDVPLPFLGQVVRVTGWPRDVLREVVAGAGFAVEDEEVRRYEPATPDAQPEVQLFLHARVRQ